MEMKMANENAPQRRLTLNDPVGKEAIDKLSELENAEVNAALQLMALEQDKVRILAVGRKILDERHRLFEKLLMDRGLAPNSGASIDIETGRLTLTPVPVPFGQPRPQPVAPPSPEASPSKQG
jgi:hypothetical protein